MSTFQDLLNEIVKETSGSKITISKEWCDNHGLISDGNYDKSGVHVLAKIPRDMDCCRIIALILIVVDFQIKVVIISAIISRNKDEIKLAKAVPSGAAFSMLKTVFTNEVLYFDILKPQSIKELIQMNPIIWKSIILALMITKKKRFYKPTSKT